MLHHLSTIIFLLVEPLAPWSQVLACARGLCVWEMAKGRRRPEGCNRSSLCMVWDMQGQNPAPRLGLCPCLAEKDCFISDGDPLL